MSHVSGLLLLFILLILILNSNFNSTFTIILILIILILILNSSILRREERSGDCNSMYILKSIEH